MLLFYYCSIIIILLEGNIPGVGELMLASFPADNRFHATVSPSNAWYRNKISAITMVNVCARWMGEKYDGVRVCWNPNKHILYL